MTVDDGVVTDIRSSGHETDRWLSAGFIDLQVNGFGGEDVNADDLDPNMILRLIKKVIATGVTTFFPTVITSSEEKIVEALRTIAEARRCSAVVAHAVPYVHVEGPHGLPGLFCTSSNGRDWTKRS